MSRHRTTRPDYLISVSDDPEAAGSLRFAFVPKTRSQARVQTEQPRQAPEYILSVQSHGEDTRWIKGAPANTVRQELETIVRQRLADRDVWLAKVGKLITTVKLWAGDLGWATRILDKIMEDPELGNYKVPTLLLQRETVRLFLEPVARTAPGTDGVVDLCLMPAYDDIASLYYYGNRWNIQYLFNGGSAALETEATPLTKATLRKVFDEMKAHAG